MIVLLPTTEAEHFVEVSGLGVAETPFVDHSEAVLETEVPGRTTKEGVV